MKRPKAKTAAPSAPVKLPVSPQTAWRLIMGGLVVLGVLAVGVWAIASGLPRYLLMETATSASKAGFVVRQVVIDGAKNQPRLSIYREVLDGGSDSILLTDLPAIQSRLVELPWVKDASIQRRWPDRLEVNIIEREPAALWQWRGQFRLIDAEGILLPSSNLAQFSSLPVIVGEGARDNAPSLLRLMAADPILSEEMKAAQWVGRRRWDIRLKTGETLSLPEGDAAEVALQKFAALNRQTPLLGRGFVRFDMRLPDKMVVRVDSEPGQTIKPKMAPQSLPAPPASTPSEQAPTQPRGMIPTQATVANVAPNEVNI